MSLNQWKFVTYLKEQVSKVGSDKNAVMLVLNKEWTNVLRRMPSVSTNVPVLLNHSKEESKSKPVPVEKCEQKDDKKFLSNGFTELITKLNGKLNFPAKNGMVEKEKVKWKSKKNVVSDLSIHARTKYIVSSILTAESENSRLQRLETLVEHFLQYPDGIRIAVKQGAISNLLNIRKNNSNEKVAEVLREALTMLGYTDPPPKRGIRILTIDGGGIRGLLVMEMLLKLEELTGRRVYELFDFICGVSTGSVIACSVGASGKSVKEVSNLYMELGNKIFTQNALFGARSLIWNHGYYNTELWEKLLKEHIGSKELIKTTRWKDCPKIAVLSTISQDDHITPFIFRNYELPYRIKSQYPGSYKYQLWEAVRASAAAPTYFEEFRLGDSLHQDGGILVNNPTAVAVHEAKQLWPKRPIQCVVSFGTGRTDLTMANLKKDKKTAKQSSWKEKFYNILVSATDTEAVHLVLNDLLPPSVYFRFNPYLTELLSMDESHPEKLATLQKDALMYIRRNEMKFQEAANALLMEKTVYQDVADWVSERVLMHYNRS